jgi:hypothetical protein
MRLKIEEFKLQPNGSMALHSNAEVKQVESGNVEKIPKM